jgi:hypothetical protein
MKDLIDHMSRCHEQLQWSGSGASAEFLTETMRRDLEECLRLCDELRPGGRGGMRAAAA